jgi:hypothetical protein
MTLFAFISPLREQRRRFRPPLLLLALIALCSWALADGRIIHVARLSLIEGEVSYQRANDARDDWFDATINLPLDEGDQVFTGNGRAEIQLTGRNIARLDRETNLKITQFNTGLTQLALSVGTATLRVESLDRRQFQIVDARDAGSDEPIYFEVDTPTVAVTLLKEGSYRLNVQEDGTTEVSVRRGAAEVYNQAFGNIVVKAGRRMVIEGQEPDFYQIARLEEKDHWDRWNDRRDDELQALAEARSTRYVPAGVPGVYDLDRYGEWWHTPDYGYVWSPRVVAVGWAPYRAGYWHWYPAYGWTWISTEPWGWAPYHYGRWAYYRSRWCWVPHGGFSLGFSWSWSPALVTFVGHGGYRRGYRDGFSDGYRTGYRDGVYDWVGWVPLAPGERHHGRTIINNTVVNNTILPPRTLDSLRNQAAPGGVSGLDGRLFANPRVAVNNPIPLPKVSDPSTKLGPIPTRGDDFKPTQADRPRAAPPSSPAASRILAAPIVTRRPVEVTTPSGTTRTIERGVPVLRGTGDAPGGEVNRTLPRRELPTRESRREEMPGRIPTRESSPAVTPTTPPATPSPGRVTPGGSGPPEERRVDGPGRRPDYQPVERPLPPRRTPNSEDGDSRNVERRDPRTLNLPRRETSPPSEGQPAAPRRVEPPPAPPAERREPPHAPPPQSMPREERRPMPPARSYDPPPRAERPLSPPPARPAEPPRQAERPPSAPPSRAPEAPPRGERPSSPPPRSPEAAPQRERPSSPPPARVPPSRMREP